MLARVTLDNNTKSYINDKGFQVFENTALRTGYMEENDLQFKTRTFEDEDEITNTYELWEGEQLRSYSVHTHMKRWPKYIEPQQGAFH